jgi:CBS domain-containing protein
MQLEQIITRDPLVIGPDTTLKEAAEKMRDLDSGIMPVGENDRLVGMLTDRDLAIRAVADGKDPNTTRLREIMTQEVVYCFEDDDARDAATKMEQHQLRRLIVLTRDKRLAGIVSLGDLAVHTADDRLAGEVTEAVSEPAEAERSE